MTAIAATLTPDMLRRADDLLAQSRRAIYRSTDRIFGWLMPMQFVAGIVAALFISPLTWEGAISRPHIHLWAAVVLGGLITGLPVALVIWRRGEPVTRHTIAVGQMLTSALLIHLTGGRIETHFHVFGSLAFLSFYRDWKVLVTATIVIAVEHFLRGVYFPQSVYGILATSSWRWAEHAGWVLFEDVVLLLSCRAGSVELRKLAQKRAQLEFTNEVVEAEVRQRTLQYAQSEARANQTACRLESVNAELQRKQQEYLRLNAALEVASREAQAASAAKSAFLANMGHEIRTPMTAILGFAEILQQDGIDPDERHAALATIERNGHHLLALINDLLDLSKIEAGKMVFERMPCPIDALLMDVEDLFRLRAHEKNIDFHVRLGTALPQTIPSDPVRLKQALVNLAGNALKFTSEGEVLIEASCDRESEKLAISVTDTGPGITPEQRDHLFQPFVQADISTTRRFGGTGLGLAITQSIARLLGGDITLASEPGTGSTFTLTIPTGPLEQVPWITTLHRNRPVEPVKHPSPRLAEPPVRILLVDDGPDNQRLLSFVLRAEGALVTVASDGAEGVQRAWQAETDGSPFDVILMDMQMPVMDGFVATSTLRKRGYRRPIIALTAYAVKGEWERIQEAGCDAVLPKPIRREVLIAEVQRLARRPAEVCA